MMLIGGGPLGHVPSDEELAKIAKDVPSTRTVEWSSRATRSAESLPSGLAPVVELTTKGARSARGTKTTLMSFLDGQSVAKTTTNSEQPDNSESSRTDTGPAPTTLRARHMTGISAAGSTSGTIRWGTPSTYCCGRTLDQPTSPAWRRQWKRRTGARITVDVEKAPSGEPMLYVPLRGGQMRFYILYDDQTRLYWMISTQSTDSMKRVGAASTRSVGTCPTTRAAPARAVFLQELRGLVVLRHSWSMPATPVNRDTTWLR